MGLEAGSRVGPYEIVARIGAGGMGEVWRARDSRLDRIVAIKTLPASLASDAQFRLRFEREAKTISQLNHPNICTLHDVGDGYLVMEYLEGETLSERIARGAMPLADVLRIGSEIAEALDRAHRQKVVHRDLKPGNVMLTKSGAKLLDFGLAKAAAIDFDYSDETRQKPLTREGTVVGTFQYMAPEQLEGIEADARTDIFALGAVLYEMATGRRAFEGKSKTSLIAAIVSGRPEPISSLQPVAPAALDHVVEKCLEKDPDKRWQSARDIVTELQWIAQAGSNVTVAPLKPTRWRPREIVAWSLAVVLLAVAGVAGKSWLRERTRPASELRFVIGPAEGTNFINGFDTLGFALSPDGTQLVFAATGADGRTRLYLRALNEIEPKVVPESEDASYPFWSPDGRHVAFFADAKLKKVEAAGGPVQVICDAPSGRGGSWSNDGRILFAPSIYSAIYMVPAAGGAPQAVTRLSESDVTHRWPYWLPNGRDFLYSLRPKGAGGRGPAVLVAATVGKSESRRIMENATNSVYANGRLYFGREQRLMMQDFDLETKTLTGEAAVVVPERLSFWEAKSLIMFTVSRDGSIVYLPEVSQSLDLKVVDRSGREVETILAGAPLAQGAAFSPDEKKIAYGKSDGPNGGDIWVYDRGRKQETRVTFEPGTYYFISWSNDGGRLLYGVQRNSLGGIYVKSLRGGTKPLSLIDTNYFKVPGNMSPDGERFVYHEQSAETATDLWMMDLATRKPKLLLRTRFEEMFPRFSPDGRWIAYNSNESGRTEVYVRRASDSPEQWQVSAGGGEGARWRSDGREIFYATADGKVMAVPVEGGDDFSVGVPRELFAGSASGMGFQDVSGDGTQFLMINTSHATESPFRAIVKVH